MEWDHLQNFLAIARHGSLSAAARALGVTQPTMGRRLTAMEKSTGARLLIRTPDGFLLTPLGVQILDKAERIEEEMLGAELLINASDVHLDGVVRVTTLDMFGGDLVTPALVRLQRENPGVSFELVPSQQSLNLSRREADIAIRTRRFEGDLIVERKIGTLALAYYQAADASNFPENLAPQIVTVLQDQSHLPEARRIVEHFPELRIGLRSNNRNVQYQAVCNGGGIGLLPRFRADHDARLIRVRKDLPDLRREIWMGIHTDLRKMPRMRATMDALIEAFDQNSHLLDPDA
ncbi:UNVERIFIED_ORG: LysR family transcriptional regulator [Martelella mediterranea]